MNGICVGENDVVHLVQVGYVVEERVKAGLLQWKRSPPELRHELGLDGQETVIRLGVFLFLHHAAQQKLKQIESVNMMLGGCVKISVFE